MTSLFRTCVPRIEEVLAFLNKEFFHTLKIESSHTGLLEKLASHPDIHGTGFIPSIDGGEFLALENLGALKRALFPIKDESVLFHF
jgi:hypothetical protein